MAESKEKVAPKKATSAVKKPAAPKKVAVKATATKAAKPAAKPKAAAPKKSVNSAKVSPEQHYRMVEVAAYYIAEKNGFAGNASEYWVQAELQINASIK